MSLCLLKNCKTSIYQIVITIDTLHYEVEGYLPEDIIIFGMSDYSVLRDYVLVIKMLWVLVILDRLPRSVVLGHEVCVAQNYAREVSWKIDF